MNFYIKKFGQVSLTKIAEDLKVFVDDNLKNKKYYVIAISQGGIVWRIFTMNNLVGRENILKIFTLCTPHNGSKLAHILKHEGIQELRPQSNLLQQLEKNDDGLEYYAIYNPLDLMVFPGTSAIFSKAQENIRVFDFFHPLTFWNKKTLRFILEKIKNDKIW